MDQRNDLLGTIVARRYEVKSLIGQGSQANIYKALDRKTKQIIALKHYANVDFFEDDDLKQIIEEGELLQSLKHPFILRCYEIIKEPTNIFITMEFVDGVSLQLFVELQFNKLVKLSQMKLDIDALVKLIQQNAKNPILLELYQQQIRKEYLRVTRVSSPSQRDLLKLQENQEQIVKQNHPSLRSSYIPRTPFNIVARSRSLSMNQSESSQGGLQSGQSESFLGSNFDKASDMTWLQIVEQLYLQLMFVLSYLHDQEIVHRDLKPDNLMVMFDESKKQFVIKLIDFGFAQRKTKQKMLVGTPGFIAPEIYLSDHEFRKYTYKADMWSAGSILFFMLCGYPPFITTRIVYFEKLQVARGLMVPPDLNPEIEIPLVYRGIMQKLLCINPYQRIDSNQVIEIMKASKKIKVLIDVDNFWQTQYYQIKILLLGDCGVGKTTLASLLKTNKLNGGKRNFMLLNERKLLKIIIIEPNGLKSELNTIYTTYLRNINVCLLVFSPDIQESFSNLDYWINLLRSYSPDATLKYVFNKYDLAEQYDHELIDQTGLQFFKMSMLSDGQLSDFLEVIVIEAVQKSNYLEKCMSEEIQRGSVHEIITKKESGC